jgi:capsular exopolysaccharide synthesis family protein
MSKIFEALQKTGRALPEAELFAPLESVVPVDSSDTTAAMVEALVPAASIVVSEASAKDREAIEKEPAAKVRTLSVRLVAKDPVLPFDVQSRRSMEQYRLIRTKIAHHPNSPHIVAVTSAGPGDGKTVTSINIAGAMSLNLGAKVLLIDGDLRRSSIAQVLGLPAKPGLSDVLSRKCTLKDALIHIEQFPNCFVLTAGEPCENPPELLDSPHWRELCTTVRSSFQNVIVDTPPIAAVADYELIEASADGIVMVARPDHTKRSAFKKAVSSVPPQKLIGMVLNDVKDWFLWKVQSGYPYEYYGPAIPQSVSGRARTSQTESGQASVG